MKAHTITASVLAGMMFVPMMASAVTIMGSPGAAFQTWNKGDLDQDHKPYWDNTSLDGEHRNIGYALTGNPAVGLSNAPGAIPFWGMSFNSANDTGGNPDLNFFLNQTGGGSNASLRLEISDHSTTNEFGWYNTSSPAILHPIFSGSESAVTNHSFDPTVNYGFYMKDGRSGGQVFYTQSRLNSTAEREHQHFALFKGSSNTPGHDVFWIGVEDLPLSALGNNECGYGDYNDMIIRIESVPEPSTLALWIIGFALTCMAVGRRREGLEVSL